MRFLRLNLPVYGTVRDLDTGAEDLGNLVVVRGPNESGKSTIFEAITTVLYGFAPASRDRHPYAPWDGTDAEVEARLLTDAGVSVSVQRRLRRNPSGRITWGEEEHALRNRPLEAVEAIPREIYRQVFALTAGELSALDAESWEQLQERLLSRMGARDIVAARSAAESLEEEAGRLWRPNKRGIQRVRELRGEIHKLLESRRDAEESDRRTRTLDQKRCQARERLRELRDLKQRTRLVVERATVLLPLKNRLERLEALELAAGSGLPLNGIPKDTKNRLEQFDQELRELERRALQLSNERDEPHRLRKRFTPEMGLALELRGELTNAAAAAAAADAVELQNAQREQQLNDLNRRMTAAAREILTAPLDEDSARLVAELPLGELRNRVDKCSEVEQRAEAEALREGLEASDQPPAWHTLIGAVALVLGTGLITSVDSQGVGAMGGGLLAIGGWLLWRWYSARQTSQRQRPHPSHGRAGQHVPPGGTSSQSTSDPSPEEAQSMVGELLNGLPLRERELDREFVSQVGRLQELQEDLRERADSIEDGKARIQAAHDAVAALGQRLSLEMPTHLGTGARQLEQFLTSAERAEEAAGVAKRELARISERLGEVSARQDELAGARGLLLDALADHGDGDPTVGLEAVADRQQANEDAHRLRAELRSEHPDLDQLVERIEAVADDGEDWLVDDNGLVAARTSLEEVEGNIEERAREEEGLTAELAHLELGITADQIDGEIAALRERLRTAVRERDRKIVLAQILRQADREFREKNDPDVIERAGAHLSAITGGRYRALVAPHADPSASLKVVDPDSGREVLAEQLSRGTQEQVYFALRLAIMDHLDADGERLPVLVDDAFVNWDPERLGRVINLLEHLGATRQVFIFTCHPAWADELCARGGTDIRLES